MKRPVAAFLTLFVALAVVASPAWAATDPGRSQQWALTKIHADQAWTKTKGAGITIAIVDTGIDLTHPDLKGKIASHYDCTGGTCVGGPGAGNDDNGHGSHLAGIAAAATGNGIGVAGVAPEAKLMAVKVLNSKGKGYCSDIVNGIRWASDHGARVINLSLGPDAQLLDFVFGNSCVTDLENAAAYAFGRGDVVVIAAGNDSIKSVYSSAALEVVGATGPNDEVAPYSNTGADVYAPGGDGPDPCQSSTNCILSTWMNGEYAIDQGTSMAAPHVSGLAALLLSEGYTNQQTVERINNTADSVGGIKRINAMRAVGASASSGSTSSTPTPRATHHASSTPTPATHTTGTKPNGAGKTVSPPSPKPSTHVLAVTPAVSPSQSTLAEGPPTSSAAHNRSIPIGIAVFGIVFVAFATARALVTRRSSA